MTTELLKDLRDRLVVLRRFFDVENREQKINNDKQLSLSPGFWDNSERATSILKSIKLNEYWLNLYTDVKSKVEDLAVLFDFWKEGEASEEEVKVAYEAPFKLRKKQSLKVL